MATRGRPKKVTQTPEKDSEAVAQAEKVETPQPSLSELATMFGQLSYQMAAIQETLAKQGTTMEEAYPKPPNEDTLVLEQEPDVHPQAKAAQPTPEGAVARREDGRPYPGTVLPGGNWVPWTKNDLDNDDVVEFVPQPVPSLVFPMTDDEGRYKIKLDVNDLVCWLTCNTVNRVNKMFFNVYQDGLNSWKELEHFKRNGPPGAPWGQKGPDGRPAWHYEPFALTSGMDIDGRYLTAGRTPVDDSGTPEEPEAI